MTPHTFYNQYRQMEATTSSDPKKLILMLYDGCLQFLAVAEQAIVDGKIEKKSVHIGKALAIISELNSCLDRKLKDEIVPYLEAMYAHMMHKLLEANLKNDRKIIQHVSRLVENLRQNWVEHAMRDQKPADAAAIRTDTAWQPPQAETGSQPTTATGTYGVPTPGRKVPVTYVA